VGCSPPPSNYLRRPPRKLELRESEPLYFKTAIREHGHDFEQLVALSLVTPCMVRVYFARRHRHRKDQSSVRAQYAVDLTERSAVVCYMFEYFKKQYGIQRLIRKRESRDRCRGKANVPQVLVPGPRALKGILIDIYLHEIPCARAHVPHKDSRTASNIRSDSESITQKITNQCVFGRSLNRNCVGHDEVIQPPHPIMLSEPFPPTAFAVHNGFVAAARVAMDAVES
jgi:hypothetical protein